MVDTNGMGFGSTIWVHEKYSSMLLRYFQFLFFRHLLFRDVSPHMLYSLASLLNTWRVYLLNKLIGVWLRTENAKCGRWYKERYTCSYGLLSCMLWCLAIVLSSQVDHV